MRLIRRAGARSRFYYATLQALYRAADYRSPNRLTELLSSAPLANGIAKIENKQAAITPSRNDLRPSSYFAIIGALPFFFFSGD